MMLSVFLTISAYDFISDGIAYTITSFADLECSVVANDEPYRGEIIIPSTVEFNGRVLTVKSIGKEAFRNNEEVTAVSLPATVHTIEAYSFGGCNNLHSILFKEGLEYLREYAFLGCSSIEQLQLPSTLIEIGAYAFQNCTSISNVALPMSITNMGEYSFSGCVNLTSIDVSMLNVIEEGVFSGCTSLSSVILGEMLSTIKHYAFSHCGFETFVIPNTVQSIGNGILSNCSNLKSFTIGNGISELSYNPIDGCMNIKEFIIADSKTTLQIGDSYARKGFGSIPFEDVYVGRPLYNGGYFLPFYAHPTLKTIKFGKQVESLKSYRELDSRGTPIGYRGWLEDCSALETIIVEGVGQIDDDFARGVTSLRKVEIYNKTTIIGVNAFQDCISLESIHLGANLKGIQDAFVGCEKLSSIYLKSENPPACGNFSSNAYLNCQLYIPIGAMSKYKDQSPWNNFWNIAESEDCVSVFSVGNLKYEIISGNDVMVIGNTISNKCELTIPETVEYYSSTYNVVAINDESFRNTDSLISIVIPKSIQEVGNNVFDGCTNLRKVVIEYGDTPLVLGCQAYFRQSGSLTPFPNPTNVDDSRTAFRNGYYDGLFYGLPIEHLVINRNIELPKYYERVLGSSTWSYPTIYDDIIYYPPFYGLSKLKSVEIGDKVTAICKNTIDAVVSAVPTTMGYTNFSQCNNIEVVISKNSNSLVGGGFTQTVYENAHLFLPNGGESSYKADEYWKQFANIHSAAFIAIESLQIESDEIVLDHNESKVLCVSINPSDASVQKLRWSSSNSSVVSVDTVGNVTSYSRDGEAIITATTTDGTSLSVSCIVKVEKGTGIDNAVSEPSPVSIEAKDGMIKVKGKRPQDLVSIYNAQGALVEATTSDTINLAQHGIFIVRVGNATYKVIL